MAIIAASDTNLRPRVKAYLREMRSRSPGASVLDIGGAANPWCDEYVTTYVDMQEVPTSREVIIGDITDDALWASLADREWDFVICTHVLEDIRDPMYVARQMQRVAAAGFVAVPNKHTELSAVESPQYPGYYHHRWVFTLQDGVLRAVAKLPLLGYYRQANRWLHRLSSAGPFMRRVAARLAPRAIPGGGMLPWYRTDKARHGLELGFIWEGGFELEYLDRDYCGPDYRTMRRRYAEGLREGL